jgi:predicted small lipoprotein YifL
MSVLAVAALTAACGKKGPLYLPDETPRQATPPDGAPSQQP